jgi:hypothetical protein
MKSTTKRLAAFIADPKSILFGFAIFNLVWVWMSLPQYQVDKYTFLAGLLLVSSILIRLNTLWSNLIAAILSGYLPIEILREFWGFSRLAEVSRFSLKHFRYFFANIEIKGVFVMCAAVTLLILTRSVYAIIHNGRSETGTEDRAR